MKGLNIFLTAIFFCGSALAQTIAEKNFKEEGKPVFVANGFVNFSAAARNQASSFEKQNLPDGASQNRIKDRGALGNDTQVFFKTGVKTQSEAVYGAVAKVEFNYNTDKRNENPNLDQAFLFSENSFGKMEAGNNKAVNQMMKVGPARFARGAGGINGKYLEHVNFPMATNLSAGNVKLPRFIMLAQSPVGHGGNAKGFYSRGADNDYTSGSPDYGAANRSHFRALKDDSFDGIEDATKLSYYTPRLEGFQFGASYTPNGNNDGITKTNIYDIDQIRIRNIFSFGANYVEDFDNIELMLSATAEKGQLQNSRENLLAYDFGASVSYFGFTLGASYGSWGKSMRPKNGIYSCDYDPNATLASQTCGGNEKKFDSPYYYTLGLAYKIGPIGASVTSLKSSFQKNEYDAISLGLDYKLTKDLMPYLEFTKFTFKSNQPRASDLTAASALLDNQGYVLLTGILFSF